MVSDFSPRGVESFSFFPTSVCVLTPSSKFLDYLDNHVDGLLQMFENSKKSSYETQSVVGGWRIENPHLRPECKVLNLYLQASFAEIPLVRKLASQNTKFSLNSWLNVHESGGFNRIHHHGASFLSGVVYLKVPPGSGNLRLKDPRPGRFFSQKFFDDSPSEMSLEPKKGMTVVFPGFLEHYVELSSYDSASAEKRVSLAFNLLVA